MNNAKEKHKRTVKAAISQIRRENFRYSLHRSGRKIQSRRWSRYTNYFKIGSKIIKKGCRGIDYGKNWFMVSLGNVITVDPNISKDELKKAFCNPRRCDLEGIIDNDSYIYDNPYNGKFSIEGFKILKVFPDNTESPGFNRTADWAWFRTKFFTGKNLEKVYRAGKLERIEYHFSMDDITFKKQEKGDYLLEIYKGGGRGYHYYAGRILKDKRGNWKTQNYLAPPSEQNKLFETRKKGKNYLYHSFRESISNYEKD